MDQPTGVFKEPIRVVCRATGTFETWLAGAGGSLVVSTYHVGKVALIGWDGRQITLLLRDFEKPLGVAVQGKRLALATRYGVELFANESLLAPDFLPDQPGRYDALYMPRATYHTADLHTHDIAFCEPDLVLVNTRFSCLARLSAEHSFTPIWRPSFVTDCVPEDRCHLNGLALRDGRPRDVTALGTTDTPGGWRANKAAGGVVIDVQSQEIVLDGLSMPHSPRWHQERLWLLNSGAGEVLTWDPATRQSSVVCRLPGYLRGLCFVGPFALVGLSKIREKHIFGGLPVQEQNAELLCGVALIDLRKRAPIGMFEFTAGCEEMYDVQFLAGVRRPMIVNLEKPAVREAMSCPESSFWLRGGQEVPIPVSESGLSS